MHEIKIFFSSAFSRKALTSYTISQDIRSDTLQGEEENADVFRHTRTKAISEREDDYRARWRRRKLSPERIDPFQAAAVVSSHGKLDPKEIAEKRSYAEILMEQKIEHEKNLTMQEIKKMKEQERKNKTSAASSASNTVSAPSSSKNNNEEAYRDERNRFDKRDRKEIRGNDNHSKRSKEASQIDDSQYQWGDKKIEAEDEGEGVARKEAPNFERSGKLAEVNSGGIGGETVLKWSEPSESALPTQRWRLYVFKGGSLVPGEDSVLQIHRKRSYLFGRDRALVDVPLDHPSCSKQHAALCYRRVQVEDKETFEILSVVKPYIIDLKSTNFTHLNGKKIDDSRYYELREGDTLKFGNSSREFVLLHENSKFEK